MAFIIPTLDIATENFIQHYLGILTFLNSSSNLISSSARSLHMICFAFHILYLLFLSFLFLFIPLTFFLYSFLFFFRRFLISHFLSFSFTSLISCSVPPLFFFFFVIFFCCSFFLRHPSFSAATIPCLSSSLSFFCFYFLFVLYPANSAINLSGLPKTLTLCTTPNKRGLRQWKQYNNENVPYEVRGGANMRSTAGKNNT